LVDERPKNFHIFGANKLLGAIAARSREYLSGDWSETDIMHTSVR
jgi:hypothetical protein